MESGEHKSVVEFIYEDNHLLVADKPAGLPSQPDISGDMSLDMMAKQYLREKYHKPGEVYLGLLHRLDRPTSGVVLMARTGKAATRMSEQFRKREVVRIYQALVECVSPPECEAVVCDRLAPASNGGMQRLRETNSDGREAQLSYRLLGITANKRRALLEVVLHTGVKHQIRCQLAARGLPVVGDHRYGAHGALARPQPVLGGRALLLHAHRVEFMHPVRREPTLVAAAIPSYWQEFLSAFPNRSGQV